MPRSHSPWRHILWSMMLANAVGTAHIRSCSGSKGTSTLECELGLQQGAGNLDDARWWEGTPKGDEDSCPGPASGYGGGPEASTVHVGVKDTVPAAQIWARCEHCALEALESTHRPASRLRTILFDPRAALQQVIARPSPGAPVVLSSTKWRGFFHEEPELMSARFASAGATFRHAALNHPFREGVATAEKSCARVITRPIFVFSILTWQIGHLLVDVLEPLFYTMMAQYGRVPTDLKPVLILQVASQDESSVFLEKLVSSIWEEDSPFALLGLVTGGRPVHTIEALWGLVEHDSRAGRLTCFTDLHLGLDISGSYYARGFDRHPHFFGAPAGTSVLPRFDEAEFTEMRRRYAAFRHWLWHEMGWGEPHRVAGNESRGGDVVMIVRRTKSRRLVNADDLRAAVESHYGRAPRRAKVREAVLESMPFGDQAALFRSSSVLVSQYGTAVHNVLFMRPGTSLILLMQPGWCDWAWSFASQAALLDMHVFVQCDEVLPPGNPADTAGELVRFRWHDLGWAQGPWWSKDADHAVDVPAVVNLLSRLDHHDLQVSRGRVHAVQRSATYGSRRCNQRHHLSFKNDRRMNASVDDAFSAYTVDYIEAGDEWQPENSKLCGARVHIGNVTVREASGSLDEPRVKVRLLAEVVLDARATSAHAFMQQHPRLVLCSAVMDSAGGSLTTAACYPASSFNEFSTLDAHLQDHTDLVLRAWLAEGSPTGSPTGSGAAGVPVPLLGSETYFPVHSARPLALRSEDFACGAANLDLDVVVDGQPRRLHVRLWEETALQRDIAAFCRRWMLPLHACAALSMAAFDRAAPLASAALAGLPPSQRMPSASEPFVFLHHEKCAGTSLRRYIARSALSLGVAFHIPCFDPFDASGPHIHHPPGTHPASCMSFDLAMTVPELRQHLAVIAGHFQWGVWQSAVGAPQSFPTRHLTPRVFVMLREPVERTVSFYYERVYPHTERSLNDLPGEDIDFLLGHFRGSAFSRWRDEGLSDTLCKMLCGLNVHKGKRPEELEPNTDVTLAASIDTKLALTRLGMSVVGLMHRWEETKLILRWWFPWIDLSTDDVRGNIGRRDGVETISTLRPGHRAKIEASNRCDLAAYTAGVAQFERELEVAAGTFFA